ncbi:MAG: cytochrome P450 [Methylotenera sp.]|uniref:cytochrome P450 n=1 Tax=Methylotenera sp. TaxID=2051956 RepID=UPI00248736DA|nr:cytochrome P450 [Methylotenera sp.]MDI1307912.1 cytochrome P450 [Methylotenera sp.]
MTFQPSYPKPHKNKTSFILRFIRGSRSWLEVLFEKSYRMKMGQIKQPGLEVFMVNDPSLIKRILVDEPKKYPKHWIMHQILKPLLGNSIFTTNGKVWERQRRLVDAGFGQARLKLVFPLMIDAIADMLNRLDSQANDKAFEIDTEMTHITADIIFRTILSQKLDAASAELTFKAFNEFQRQAQRAFMLKIYWLPSFFAKRASNLAANKIRPVIADVIAKRYREKDDENAHQHNDILAGIMEAVDPEDQDSFSYDEMVDQICMLFLAGHETSASALTWSMYLISNCPDLQMKMYEEIQAVTNGQSLEFEHIKKLSTVNNVFKEALRLYPPVGFFTREATENHCMRDKEIKAGAALVISPWLIQRNEDYWKNAHNFEPERFDTVEGKESEKCAYIPFSKGPRVCTGQTFAIQEAILILASLVRQYKIHAVTEHVPHAVGRVTIRPENGVKIRLTQRT